MPERPPVETLGTAPVAEQAPKTLADVVFTAKEVSGKTLFRSSDLSRKMAELEPHSKIRPKTGVKYDVVVIEDTNPSNPTKGKYVVKIVGEDGVPIAENAPELETSKFPRPIEIDRERGFVLILETEVPYNPKGGPLVPRPENFTHFTLDARTLRTLDKIATAVELAQPCLLEGGTAASKTSAIEYMAMVTNREVIRMNMSGQTDTSELIGKYVPNDGSLQIALEEMLRYPESLTPSSREILDRVSHEGRTPTLVEWQKIAANEGLRVPEWIWKDGAVPQAMKEGKWLILDELTLAEPQVRERLNPVLEKNPSLTLTENGGYKIGPGGQAPVSKGFGMFGTTNPADFTGRNPMSPAEKDRWTSYLYVESPSEADYVAMMHLMVYGEQPEVEIRGQKYQAPHQAPLFLKLNRLPGMTTFIQNLAKFESMVEGLAEKREIGRSRKEKYVFTRRGLIEFLNFLENKTVISRLTRERVTISDLPNLIALRAIEYFFLDKIVDKTDRTKVENALEMCQLSAKTLKL
jgi:MoxR-like ATPase